MRLNGLIVDCLCAYTCGGVVGCRLHRSYPGYHKYHRIYGVSTDNGLIVGLVVGVFTVVGTVIAATVVGLTAAFLAIIAGVTSLFAITSRTIVKIVSLPFRPCLRGQDPLSPLGTSSLDSLCKFRTDDR